ncbi:staygreen family protein [Bacillus sp. B15-48]|uniref:staygreen family protein n=1 Tax=Bacillus sp. B15-48 TaxID=1548601 RepID=UPI00193F1CB5|nr:hypothetical protein [Bacillus sp. B15-48]
MNKFNPDKLYVKYSPPMNGFGPIEGRKYTLTHSDETGELYLTIGRKYDYVEFDQKLRDEVLGEWKTRDGEYMLLGKVYISGGEFDEKFAKVRYLIFKKELELALTAIIYGDRNLFLHYPWLLDSSIYIQFESIYPEYDQILYYGTPRQYLAAANKRRGSQTKV